MGLLPYFPLASGLLTGKYKHGGEAPKGTRMAAIKRLADRFMTEDNWKIVDALQAFCDARGRSLLELAFSWLLAQPCLSSVIAGATRPEQIEANVKAAGWKLSAEELAQIDAITKR
jgi:aryl-alcohol dehydrogenase-like predicted oxidoreductase